MVHPGTDEERLPLNRSGNFRNHESIINRENAVMYCNHGNLVDKCCSKTSKETGVLANGNLARLLSEQQHCHDGVEDEIDTSARKRLIFVSCLCLAFMTGEAVGGIIANSLAVATDAAHLLTDFAGFMISLMALYVSGRPATKRMSFGWYRAEVLGALISVLLIWVVTAVLVYMAVQRVRNGNYEVDGSIMLITATFGVVINLIMGFTLQFGCVPKPNPDEEEGLKAKLEENGPNRVVENINVRAAFIHVIGDLIQSIGVLTAAFVIYYKPEYSIVDPICTFLFSVLVLITTVTILRDVINVLMEGTPSGMQFQEVMKMLCTIPGVVKVHNLRIWSLSMDKTALSAHIVIGSGDNSMKILKEATKILKDSLGIFEITLQVEEYKHGMEDCSKCKGPQK